MISQKIERLVREMNGLESQFDNIHCQLATPLPLGW